MVRKIIHINPKTCNGCGLCAAACHEGAIQMINGKAVLTREDYCDGLGDCLPACPTGAITFEEREAPAYDQAAVKLAKRQKESATGSQDCACAPNPFLQAFLSENPAACESCLSQWPVQIKLLPVCAPYFNDSDLLIAADCTAFAYGGFHRDFIQNRTVLVGCPKLDSVDYSEKLTEILAANSIKSITVVRMEVPCCKGIQYAVEQALEQSGKDIPLRVVIIGINGSIIP